MTDQATIGGANRPGPVRRLCSSLMPASRSVLPAMAVALLLVAMAVAPAVAQTLSERVVDEAGVMSDAQVAEAEAAITALEDDDNVQLWALYVDTTGGEEVTDFADGVAAENGLGGNDALLVVAIDDRRDALWIGDLLTEVSDQELDLILADQVEPQLRDSEWGAAVAGAAEGLSSAVAGDVGPDETPGEGETPAPGDDDGPSPFWVLLAVAAISLGGWILVGRWRAGRAAEEDDRERERRLRGLSQRANTLLIETDELLRHNAQELGFVEAEFGKEAAEPFAVALAAAREELKNSFRIRQQLDDGIPEEPPQREQMLTQVVAHCDKAHELVEAQTKRFQELRDLERRAPEVLSEQELRVSEASTRLPAVEQALAVLRVDASGSSEAVHGNIAEARKRLEIAGRAATDGLAALKGGNGGAAARAAKASQDALAQAGALLDAIQREGAALEEARSSLDAALASARADLDQARAAVAGARDTDQQDELTAALQKVDAADAARQGTPRDLVLAYRLASEAESAAEQVVAKVREGEERRIKELGAVDAAIRAAELSADRAEEFIASRGHGIGRRARTALSEADGALNRARMTRDTDPQAALADARHASQLADAAYERARSDFDATVDDGRGGTVVIGGQPYPTGRQGNWGSDVGGAIIGGIIGSILSGGGRGWGGGGGGFGGFGRGGGGGGFGGGRSIGGGFGGGGGHSRGGGW